MTGPSRLFRAALLIVLTLPLALPLALASCKPKSSAPAPGPAAAIAVTDDRQGLLLTWLDAKGDFHVETSVADVPLEGRDAVRVIDTSADVAAQGDTVTVADLRNKLPDGTYPAKLVTRGEFDGLASARREKAGIAMAKPASAAAASGPSAGPGQADDAPARARPAVIIYGASWCHACHEAARYLASRNIAYVEKDIEENADAAREMNTKLRSAGRRGGSIPVLDVRGTILVGFSADEVERALGKAT